MFSGKDYRDPLYGFVRVNGLEQSLIDTSWFQRLRHIRQLGTSYLVYPSAVHTRFEHSIGTLGVTEQMMQVLFSNQEYVDILGRSLGWDGPGRERARQVLRLAALLHDLGHAPFSHAAERLFPADARGAPLDHEDYTYRLITETEIGGLIDGELGPKSAEEVAGVAVNRAGAMGGAFLSELLAGDFGADRIDYLMRDSHHLGVQYGRFDVHRLLNTLRIRFNEEKMGPELAVEDGGLHTVEAFVLARYFMFLDVYFHKTRRILDHHLGQFMAECLAGGTYPVDLDAYVGWDDHRVMCMLQGAAGTEHAERLLRRGHLRLAFETADHPRIHELERFDWLKTKVREAYGAQVEFDEASKAAYAFDQPEVTVWHHKQREYKPLSESSSLVRSLQKIQKCRVYATAGIRADVTRFCREFWATRSRERQGES